MKKNIPWVGAFVILVLIFGTIYGVVQQSQRTAANEQQIRLAEDTAEALNNGVKPSALPQGKVDIGKSLAPFINIYDTKGEVLNGNGYLQNEVAKIPKGVLFAADGKDYHAITWQPTSDLRFAAVTVKANGYYVLGAKSLREVEKNEQKTLQVAFLGGFLSATTLLVAYLLFSNQTKTKAPKKP
jgi:hypothetical protein